MSYLDFGDNKGYAKDNLMMIYARADQCELQPLKERNSLNAAVSGVSATFSSENTRVREYIFSSSGHVDVEAKNISVSVELKMDTLPANDTNSTGRLIPGIKMGDISLNIDH